jgi:SOS-response transcriptional repressor LexA
MGDGDRGEWVRPRVGPGQIRRVWAQVTRTPQASVREMVDAMGLRSTSGVGISLRILREAGYIDYKPGRSRARRVVVPFYEMEVRHAVHADR